MTAIASLVFVGVAAAAIHGKLHKAPRTNGLGNFGCAVGGPPTGKCVAGAKNKSGKWAVVPISAGRPGRPRAIKGYRGAGIAGVASV